MQKYIVGGYATYYGQWRFIIIIIVIIILGNRDCKGGGRVVWRGGGMEEWKKGWKTDMARSEEMRIRG